MKTVRTGPALAAVLVLSAAVAVMPSAASAQACDYFNPQLLVDVDWLERNIDHHDLRIIDFGRRQVDYAMGHIPCASFIERGALARTADGVPDQLIAVEELVDLLESAGVDDRSTVVIYDDSGGLWASRLFWAMEYLGHRDVRLLDGGWDAWIAGDRDVGQEPASPPRGQLTPSLRPELLATKEWILARLGDPGVVMLDVRTPEEFSGTDRRAARGGHIPGAVNIEWAWNLDEAESRVFLAAGELSAIYSAAGVTAESEVATYCQAGVRATHTYFSLRLLGYPHVRVYDGSWVEWGNDPDTPIAVPAETE